MEYKREEIVGLLKRLAEPIDFEHLQQQGIISKERDSWYSVRNIRKLPEHASRQITRRDWKDGILWVKFATDRDKAKVAKLIKRVVEENKRDWENKRSSISEGD